MGGLSIAAIGYEMTGNTDKLLLQHGITPGVSSFKSLLKQLESEISLPLSLARLEDSGGHSRMFICCYVDYQIRVYDCEELMSIPVPPQFPRVRELLGIDGTLKRVFAPQGAIFAYDSNGRSRVTDEGLSSDSFGSP